MRADVPVIEMDGMSLSNDSNREKGKSEETSGGEHA